MIARMGRRFLLLVLAMCWPALAEIPDPPEPSEQGMQLAEKQGQWVQRFQQASNLLAGGEVAKALRSFESLRADLPDLDSEGLVAVAIGDCQFNLRQYEKARQTYLQAEKEHPDLASRLWVRRTEIDVAAGNVAAARTTLKQIIADSTDNEMKDWALLRLAVIQERQAIGELEQAQDAYSKASQPKADNQQTTTWAKVHAEDLADAVAQLRTALRQLDSNLMWLSAKPNNRGDKTARVPEGIQVAKAQAIGTVRRVLQDKGSVELTIDEKGKIEASLDGRPIQLDPTTERQIRRHIEQSLRLAVQAGNQPTGGNP